MSDCSIKIFKTCHEEKKVLDNPYIIPITLGSVFKKDRIEGYQDDDVGENRSNRYEAYLALTAVYWAWKNVDADYVGFFHDKNYLSFNSNVSGHWGSVPRVEELLKNHSYDGDIGEIIQQYDVISPRADTCLQKTNYEMYAQVYCQKDLEAISMIIKDKYPTYYEHFNEYIHSKSGIYSNMFVMKKEIFQKYCEWLFSILDTFDEYFIKSDDIQAPRHIAERLTGFYLYYLRKTSHYKILDQQIVMVEDEDIVTVRPYYDSNCVIVLSSDNNYVPFLGVIIQSIYNNSSEDNTYDIVILNEDISEYNRYLLKHPYEGISNFKVRFFNMKHLMQNYQSLPIHGQIKLATYFRYFIPDIFDTYHKALYLDVDMVVNSDIAELCNLDIHDYYLAATIDADSVGLYYYDRNRKEYVDKEMNLKDPHSYFQAGVILFNLDKFRKEINTIDLLTLSAEKHWQHLDQDVLNLVCQNHIKFVDMSWDFLYDFDNWRSIIVPYAPHRIHSMYLEARKHPKIVHYAGPKKPWDYPSVDCAFYFWDVARQTVFYEQLLSKLIAIKEIVTVDKQTTANQYEKQHFLSFRKKK